jgi:hypothetical protein
MSRPLIPVVVVYNGEATVQHAFYSDAIGNLHALESDADPARLRVTSRRVFQ